MFPSQPSFRDPTVVWAIVAAYVAHLAEEYLGRFPEWFGLIAGRPLPLEAFLAINGIGLAAMTAAAHGATRRPSLGWMAIGLGTIVVINGAAHLLASLVTGTYSPGVITGTLLYLPLGSRELGLARRQALSADFRRGVLAGLAAHGVVTLTAIALS